MASNFHVTRLNLNAAAFREDLWLMSKRLKDNLTEKDCCEMMRHRRVDQDVREPKFFQSLSYLHQRSLALNYRAINIGF